MTDDFETCSSSQSINLYSLLETKTVLNLGFISEINSPFRGGISKVRIS
tara:strand:- start:2417 stop:2563 length:147 start_codon:yes stop_codon:yes gene_type:complete